MPHHSGVLTRVLGFPRDVRQGHTHLLAKRHAWSGGQGQQGEFNDLWVLDKERALSGGGWQSVKSLGAPCGRLYAELFGG